MPGDINLPTKDDLALVPRWARVAFSARCARGVYPLLERRSELARDDLFTVDDAVRRAEECARTASALPGTGRAANAALEVAKRLTNLRTIAEAAGYAALASNATAVHTVMMRTVSAARPGDVTQKILTAVLNDYREIRARTA